MWKLNKIEARNLCAFRELGYTVKQGVTTLIFGDNRDNESQRSNGSGKSALLECIAIGITGSPLRKIKNEEIINDAADESYVSLVFSNSSYNEVFSIERTLYRKGASGVRCLIEREGKTVTSDEAVQHSVDAYNKYILEKLGITRDELFNNFILSKHKYEDFLSCSDKEKKEIINRFSNGIVVDEAIAKITEDIAPIEKELRETDLAFAGLEGRIGMLTEQIELEENSREERARTKSEKLAEIKRTIDAKRNLIWKKETEQEALNNADVELTKIETAAQALEDSDKPLEDVLEKVKHQLSVYGALTDWKEFIESKKIQLSAVEDSLAKCREKYTEATNRYTFLCEKDKVLKSEYALFAAKYQTRSKQTETELQSLERKLKTLLSQSDELKTQRRSFSSSVETLKNKLAGTITCPACNHGFIIADKTFDVIAGKKELSAKQELLAGVAEQITKTEELCVETEAEQRETADRRRMDDRTNTEWLQRLADSEKENQTVFYELETMARKERQIVDTIALLQQDIDGTRRKIFDEAFGLIDSASRTNERQIQTVKEEIEAANSSIETLHTTMVDIKDASPDEVLVSLRASLKTYRQKSDVVLTEKTAIEKELGQLREQEERFGQFKSYLANTKIEALSKITNEFLESIGSDIRIRFSGYTMLKTGKVREKISVSLVRDGIDCGSFGKFSEGEKARVNLSSILAMQKLVNSNCDDDKGLDLLVLDEILAAVDEEGNAKMFESLNKLGITALVVSHGHVSESYPHTLLIRKENGESRIV